MAVVILNVVTYRHKRGAMAEPIKKALIFNRNRALMMTVLVVVLHTGAIVCNLWDCLTWQSVDSISNLWAFWLSFYMCLLM